MQGTIEGKNRADVHGLLWLGAAALVIVVSAFADQWLAP